MQRCRWDGRRDGRMLRCSDARGSLSDPPGATNHARSGHVLPFFTRRMFRQHCEAKPPRRAPGATVPPRRSRRRETAGPAQLGGCSLPRVRAYVQQPRSPLLLPPRPRVLPRDRRIKAQIGVPIAEHTQKRRFAARKHDTPIARSQSRWRWRPTCRATMLSPQIGQPQWTCHRKHSSHSCSGKLPSHPGPPSHMSPFQPGSHRLLCFRHRSIHDRGNVH